ncbi:MAG: Cytidine deaminase [Gemmatimonadaceae bacterium]|nr:Cytidine deaminase [Gemmatimonadaceae bacterium]
MGAAGGIFAGCNVENSVFPAGLCAERSALASAIANGEREFSTLVVATEADEPTPPCGICRQVLVEFAPSLEIVSITAGGASAHWRLAELLAHPFTSATLSHS